MERRIEDPGEEGSRRRRRSRQAEESVRAVEDEVMGSVRSGDFFFRANRFLAVGDEPISLSFVGKDFLTRSG